MMTRWLPGVGLLGWALISVTASASPLLRTRIQAVSPGAEESSPYQVLAIQDGRIYDAPVTSPELIEKLRLAAQEKKVMDLTLADDTVTVLDAFESPREAIAQYVDEFLEAEMAAVAQASGDAEVEKLLFPLPVGYEPTILASRAEADALYRTLFRDTAGNSQCFQRASYWAFNLQLYQGVRSMKAFLFFSNAYRHLDPDKPEMYYRLGYRPARDGAPDHRWWFHVAPMVYVKEADWAEPAEFVLDAGFPSVIQSPLLMKPWTDVFVDTRKYCPVIDNFSVWQADEDEWIRDRKQYKRTLRGREHCWVRVVSMYHHQPSDVQTADQTGIPVRAWSPWALKNSECAVKRCGLF
jgi:hypothetical protein